MRRIDLSPSYLKNNSQIPGNVFIGNGAGPVFLRKQSGGGDISGSASARKDKENVSKGVMQQSPQMMKG